MTDRLGTDAGVDQFIERFDHHDPALTADVLDDVYDGLLSSSRMPWTDAHGGVRLVPHWDDINAVERNCPVFSSAQGVLHPPQDHRPKVIPLEMDRPEHPAMRKLFTDILGAPRVKHAEPYLRNLAEKVVAEFCEGDDDDFVEAVAVQLPIRAIGHLLGWEEAASVEIQANATMMFEHYGTPEAMDAAMEVGRLYQAQIDDRRANPRDDYLTSLLHREVDGRLLTDEELRNIVQTFIFAGFETTSHAIGSTVYYLAQHPEVQDLLRESPGKIINTVEEGLRLFPPVHNMFRTVVEPATMHDVDLAPGDVVALLYGAANTDPEKFECPHEFQVDRANAQQHLAFGVGPHFCAGAPLARAEIRLLLEVLTTYPNYELAGTPQHLPHLIAGQMMGLKYLPLRFTAGN